MITTSKFGLPAHAIHKLNLVFKAYPRIESVIIYGSRAIGNYRKGSDIDLCIESEAFKLTDLLDLENKIDDLLLPWNVDLCLKSHIDNPELLEHIKQYGQPFYP